MTTTTKIVFTHLWVEGFGWENTICQPEDFIDIEYHKNEEGAVFLCAQENGKIKTLKGHYESTSAFTIYAPKD